MLSQDNIRYLTLHQLGPELAELLSTTSYVIFIDGSVGDTPGEIIRRNVHPINTTGPSHHHITPETLLSLSVSLYGRAPFGILFAVTGLQFDFGESLSPVVQEKLPDLVQEIRSCILELEVQLQQRG